MNPDHAFLVGLLHEIGVIPILVVADQNPELSRLAGYLDNIILQLKNVIGAKLLLKWGFADEYVQVVEQVYYWNRKGDKADYCDLVQAALLHSHLVGGERILGLELRELPAFFRLGLNQLDPTDHMKLLKDLSKRARELINMLCG